MIILTILPAFALLYLIEAKLETFVIAMKNAALAAYPVLNKLEHKWSAIYTGFLSLSAGVWYSWLYGWSGFAFLLIFILITMRRLFFDYPLRKLRGRNMREIEGDQFFDNLARRLFGSKGGYIELSLLILTLLISIYFLLRGTPDIEILRHFRV